MEPVMDLSPLVAWAGALALLLSLGTSLWTIMAGPSKANAARIDALGRRQDEAAREVTARLDSHDLRLSRLEQALQAMPTKDDMHRLDLSLKGMEGELREMKAVMEGNNRIMERLENIVTRHEEHLLDGSKK
jgi:hypothetical protein